MIFMYGITEAGSIYEIRLIPTLINQWALWYQKYGYLKPDYAQTLYKQYLKQQYKMDMVGPVIR